MIKAAKRLRGVAAFEWLGVAQCGCQVSRYVHAIVLLENGRRWRMAGVW
jgi:hypothetical protein